MAAATSTTSWIERSAEAGSDVLYLTLTVLFFLGAFLVLKGVDRL